MLYIKYLLNINQKKNIYASCNIGYTYPQYSNNTDLLLPYSFETDMETDDGLPQNWELD